MDTKKLVSNLNRQIEKIGGLDIYNPKLAQAGIEGGDIQSLDQFRRIPFTTFSDLQKNIFSDNPPFGCFYRDDVVRINFTPSGEGLMPVLNTAEDIRRMDLENAHSYMRAGLEKNDILLTTFSAHVFPAGSQIVGAVEASGAKIISVGPGETQRTLEIIKRFGVNCLYTNPSFAIKLASLGMKNIKVLFAGGEPFSSVKGYKDRVRDALGSETLLIDAYATALSMPVARECRHETGLHVVEELVYVEIIDPHTGDVLPDSERGEIVLTHLHKQAIPLLRYRTGDLARMEHIDCGCGMSATLTGGVLGRTDNMVKIKGVKIYPSQINLVLKSYPEIADKKYKIVVSRPASRADYFRLEIEAPEINEAETLIKHLKENLMIKVDEIAWLDHLDGDEVIKDNRY